MILKMLVWNDGENGKMFSLLYHSFFWYGIAEATVSADFLHGDSAVHEWYKMQKVFFFVPCWYDSKSRTDAFLSDAGSGTKAVAEMENCFLFCTSQIWQIMVILLVWNGGRNAKRLSVLYRFCQLCKNKKAKEKSCCKCQHNSLTFRIVYCKNGKRLSVLYRLQVVLQKKLKTQISRITTAFLKTFRHRRLLAYVIVWKVLSLCAYLLNWPSRLLLLFSTNSKNVLGGYSVVWTFTKNHFNTFQF